MEPGEITAAKNLKAEHIQLMQEMPVKQQELTDILSLISKANDDLVEIKAEKKSVIDEADKKLSELQVREEEVVKHEQAFEKDKQSRIDEISNLEKDKKQALKELARTNSYVLAAQEELTKLTIDIANANEELKHLVILVAKVEQTKLDLADLEDKKGAILREISTEKKELDSKLKMTSDRLAVIETLMVEAQKKTEASQIALKSYTDQLYTAMNDYTIIRTRLEERWKTTFPELELPLMI